MSSFPVWSSASGGSNNKELQKSLRLSYPPFLLKPANECLPAGTRIFRYGQVYRLALLALPSADGGEHPPLF
jgi:hypothetical protein